MRSRVKFTAGAGTSLSDIVDETQGTGNPTGEDTVRTAVDGIASATWTLNQAGQRTLTVSGIGYSTPPKTGDGGVNGLEDISSNPFVVTFTALACDEPATGEVDGVVAEGEYSELLSQTFDANISGGSSAPSVLYFRNDCENIYLALTVDAGPGVDKVNSWRIDLDDDKNGRSVGDDVVIIDVDDPTAGDPTLTDMFMTQSCLKKKQASCGELDPDEPTTDKVVMFTNDNGLWTYEVSIPLSNADPGHDVSVALGNGDVIGVSNTLQIGNGAQGNTQAPGFKLYYIFDINP